MNTLPDTRMAASIFVWTLSPNRSQIQIELSSTILTDDALEKKIQTMSILIR